MKEKFAALAVCGDDIAKLCSTHPLYEVLYVCASLYEDIVFPFKLTLEQLMFACLETLEHVRNGDFLSTEESDAMFYHFFETYEQLAPTRCLKQSIAFAALMSLRSAYFCMEAMESAFDIEYDTAMKCLKATIDRYGNAYYNKRETLENLFQKNLFCEMELLWKLDFLPFLKNFMEGKEHILDEMKMVIAKQTQGSEDERDQEKLQLRHQLEESETKVKALEEELAALVEEEKHEGQKFHIIPLVILFEALLGKRAVASDLNVKKFSEMLNKVSGYGISSIDNKIPSQGLDYKSKYVNRMAKEVISYLEPVSPEMAMKIREKLTG